MGAARLAIRRREMAGDHVHGSRLHDQGVNIVTISKRPGHATVSQTCDIYVHPSEESAEATADIWEEAISA